MKEHKTYNSIKAKAHRKFKWFKCRFSPLDAYEKRIQCRWCGEWYKSNGEPPYIGAMKLKKLTQPND